MPKTPVSDLPLADLQPLALRENKGEALLRTFSTLDAIGRAGVDQLRQGLQGCMDAIGQTGRRMVTLRCSLKAPGSGGFLRAWTPGSIFW